MKRPLLGGVALTLCLLSTPLDAFAAVVAPAPGQSVVLLEEHVLVVYDPLTATQTLVVQHIVEGTSSPFGLLIPTPKPARLKVQPERLARAIRRRLHPHGKVTRDLDFEITSWLGGCAMRPVGDGVIEAKENKRRSRLKAVGTALGTSIEPIHDWLLLNGFTLAPIQASWLRALQRQGWSVTGIVVRPPETDGPPPPILRGPVLAFTHPADEPTFAIGHPPFALDAQGAGPSAKLEVAVLTEWSVDLDQDEAPEPFYSDTLSSSAVASLSREAGGLPWAFRRNGTLTAFKLDRANDASVIRFSRAAPRATRRPTPDARTRAYKLKIPIELLLLSLAALGWAWLRYGRRQRDATRLD